jgi:hypothetical protein
MTDLNPSFDDRNLSTPRPRPGRAERPERVVIGGETFVRNDVLAKEQRVTERTINRGDRRGAPFIYLYGVKYRPEGLYGKFIASGIKTRKPTTARRRRASTTT